MEKYSEEFELNLIKFVEKIRLIDLNFWQIYKIARLALRYGHWKLVALPLLTIIKEQVFF